MSRNLTASLLAQFTARQLRPVIMFEGEFSSGWVRAWSGYGDLLYPKFRFDFMTGELPANAAAARASAGSRFDTAGDFVNEASDVGRFTHSLGSSALRGFLNEPSRVNPGVNSRHVGGVAGSPGTLPTSMTSTGGAGLTRTLAFGTAAGRPYMDLSYSGVPSSNVFLNLGGATGFAAVVGETWSSALGHQLMAGALTNIDSFQFRVSERSSGGLELANSSAAFTPTSTAQILPTLTRTLTNASTVGALPYLRIGFTLSGAVNFTIRVFLQTIEKASALSSVILSDGSATTRAADVLTLSGLPNGIYDVAVQRESGTTTYSGQAVTDGEYIVPTDVSPVQEVRLTGASLTTYQGVGALGAISAITETGDVKATGINVTLSGVPASLISTVYGEARQGKPGIVRIAALADDGYLVPSPFPAFSGKLDVPQDSDDGETATIGISYESRLVDLERSRERRYTPEDQAIDEPGDKGFDFVAPLQDAQVIWGRS